MATGLPVSRLINVQVNLAPLAAQFANFDTLLLVGDSSVIDTKQRIRGYNTIQGVAADFSNTSPEYLAAQLYFDQTPQPSQLYIGRWAYTAVAGLLKGGVLNAAQQNITNFNNINNGGVNFVIDGVARNLANLDFTSTSNLNGVASVINAALGVNGSCTWDGQEFNVSSATTGGGVQASGTFTFSGNPAANDTISVNGTAITFVASGATGSQVNIGSSAVDTVANLLNFLQASADTNISLMTYARNGLVITCTAKVVGTAGNAYTLAKTSTAITISGATLTGGKAVSSVSFATAGSGTDISALLKLTAATAQYTVNGINAESLLSCVQLLDNLPTSWYGLEVVSTNAQVADRVAVAGYIEASNNPHIFGMTTSDTAALSSTDTTSIGYQLKQLGYHRSFVQYSSTTPHAVASVFGRAFTVDFNASNSAICLMYKQEPGVIPEALTSAQADALNANNYSYFVGFNNGTNILVNGTMANGIFFDSVHNADWLANNIQTNVYNLLYQSPTKIPQTDAGNNLIQNAIEASCQQGVINGYLAPGVWNSGGFGQLVQGGFLSKGYYIYAPSVNTQAQSDREARKSVPFQVAVKEAGAIQTVQINVNVNR